MSNSSDSDLSQCFVGPDLGSNYLQKLSAEDFGQRINGNKFHLYKELTDQVLHNPPYTLLSNFHVTMDLMDR